MHMREGSFRQRAKRSELLTEQLREHRRRKVAAQTHEALQQFEESLHAEQEAMSRAYDDLPSDADGFAQQRKHGFGASHSSHSRFGMHHSHSDHTILGPPHDTGIEKDPRIQKPPSPLTFYDYGSVSPKSRSGFLQHRRRIGEAERAPFRHTSCGFYFPGSHCKQGTYGDKMLDPVLMPPKGWAPPVEGVPGRRYPDPADLRPLASQALQEKRHLPRGGQPTPDIVRSNATFEHRTRRHHEALHKRREEAVLEQARFENGVFDARWRDFLLDSKGALPEHGPAEEHSWLAGAAFHYLAGREEELGLSPAKLGALRLVVSLDTALRQARGRILDLFAAENAGPTGQLEPDEFIRGLERLGITATLGFSEDSLCQAMSALDPRFDGRISLPLLSRSLKALNANRSASSPNNASFGSFGSSLGSFGSASSDQEPASGKSVLPYGQASPVDSVKMELQSDSICTFERSFDKFRDQQMKLFVHHQKTQGPNPNSL